MGLQWAVLCCVWLCSAFSWLFIWFGGRICLEWDRDLTFFQEVLISGFLRLLRNSRKDLVLAPGPGRFPRSCSPSPGGCRVYGGSCKV